MGCGSSSSYRPPSQPTGTSALERDIRTVDQTPKLNAATTHTTVRNGSSQDVHQEPYKQISGGQPEHNKLEIRRADEEKEQSTNNNTATGPNPSTTGDTHSGAAQMSAEERQNVLAVNKEKAQKSLQELRDMAAALENRIREQMQKATESLAAQIQPSFVAKIIHGDFDAKCPSEARVVRIFVSSTFTDTRHERNWLMEKVFPKLKTFCQNNGYDFQVVDMRWGIRDEAQDDHMTTDICLREVQLCKEQSTGPCFMSLMSHKYGYRDFPRSVPAEEFDALIAGVSDEEAKEMLLRWFRLDENAAHPTYVLQPISSLIPDTKSDVKELRTEAWNTWTSQNSYMHSALAHAARQVLEESRHDAYARSVSEAETDNALADVDKQRLVWFRRIITDINQVDVAKERSILRRFKDVTTEPLKDEESEQLLKRLEENTLTQSIPKENIFQYKVQWEPNKGIDPESNLSHYEYLIKLCHDAESRLVDLCRKAFNQRHNIATRDPLFLEVLQHINFCHSKCNAFYGRAGSLKKIEDYLKGPSKQPLIIHGPSGCGKTSLVAMAAKMTHEIHENKAIMVIRFIATTPESTTITGLLGSVIKQLTKATKLPLGRLTNNVSVFSLKQLVLRLVSVLKLVSKTSPVVLLLDSLDQFDPSNNARSMAWLPNILPDNCKIIVSTLPDAQYEAFPFLEAKFKEHPDNFLEVAELDDNDISGILDKWLESAGRRLTTSQRFIVLDAFQKCPLPLFLKLAFDEACKWKSYTPPEMSVVESTIRTCINRLFSQMEITHGKIFISRALGYLTISLSGLSDAELEDILSCDEKVLGDVYRYWTPPIRRLPPLLLVRVKRDLGQYVVERGANGKQVFYWYHRQFIEAASERYCRDPDTVKEFHEGLADFFAGTWAETPKPYTDNEGKEQVAQRLVTAQPLMLGTSFNTRKLGNQAHHRIRAGQLVLLEKDCLINYDFLVTKIKCMGIRSVLDDFLDAQQTFSQCESGLKDIGEALQLSQNAIAYDARLFPSQMLGRIRSPKTLQRPAVSEFLSRCGQADHLLLEPDRPLLKATGGSLLHSIAVHSDSIESMVVSQDGTKAVTCESRGVLKTYDIQSGKVLRTITAAGKEAKNLRFANEDSIIIVEVKGQLYAFDFEGGAKKWSIDFPVNGSTFMVGGPNFSRILLIRSRTLTFVDANTGEQLAESAELPETIPQSVKFGSHYPAIGCEKYMVTVESDQKGVFVFDAVEMKLSHFKKVLKSYKDEKNEKVDATVDGLAISHDGSTLYMANYMDNDLHLVDTATLDIIKVFPGCKADYSDKFRVSNDNRYLYFSQSDYVRVWDLETGHKASVLAEAQGSNLEDVFTPDMNTYITYNSDRSLKIWDLSRSENPNMEFKDLPRDHKAEAKKGGLRSLEPLDSPRYFFTESSQDKTQTFGIFDAATKKEVCQARWTYEDSNHKLSYVRYMGDWKISFESNNRCRVLDLKTMKVTCVVQGQAPQYSSECYTVNGGKELATLSRGRMNIKLVDMKTGKISAIMKAGQKNRIDTIVTNKTGTKIAVDCEGPFLVFDVLKRSFELEIKPAMVEQKDDLYLSDSVITDDGTYLMFQAEYGKPKSDTSIFVFSIPEKTLKHVLVDKEAKPRLVGTDMSISVDGFQLLDDTRIVATHDDYNVRVWDFVNGTLLQTLRGHISYVSASVLRESPFLVTNGSWDEEYTIRLWDTNTWNCVALYRYEDDIDDVQLLGPKSCTLIARRKNETQPLMFILKGKGSEEIKSKSEDVSACPSLFKPCAIDLDLSHPSDDTIDNDNPDSDPEEVDDDDDDDDDDDEEDSDEKISDDEDWLKS